MKASLFALLPLYFALAGCVTTTPEPGEAEARCGAGELQHLVGQPATVLETIRFSQPLRVIGPGMAVTMDFSPTRLNIDLGEDGRITRLWCG